MPEPLTQALSALVGEMAEEMVERLRAPGPLEEKARRLHADERVGEDFTLWADLLARRAAVLWVLKSVYVRVLEDRKLIPRSRILDPEAQQLFGRLAPSLGETAFLKWVYRDLGSPEAGLADLFAPQPAEIVLPSDEGSRKLLDLWRRRDPDTGALAFDLSGERFSGRLMGDLYQDLDPVVKERYALLQTPDFIIDFILDQTLEPAIEEWGVDEVRVLDPSCGSGHFLLAAFRRLVERTRAEHPDRPSQDVMRSCLARVVGIDLNDYACALARARLVMTALELMGTSDLSKARDLHPQVFWADGLEQVERDELRQEVMDFEGVAKPPALMTRPEVRAALRPVLQRGFHAVVGNPPYITEKDEGRRSYHKEKVHGSPRYLSAYRTYSLVSPFLERCFQLGVEGAQVGAIVGNAFMKREFGTTVIEQVLSKRDLTLLVDLSGVRVPGHGTPTALVFARNRRPAAPSVTVVHGRRGDPPAVKDAASGPTWTGVRDHATEPGFEDEYVSVKSIDRSRLDEHPWCIAEGGELKYRLDDLSTNRVGAVVQTIGFGAVTREDEAYLVGGSVLRRYGVPLEQQRPLVAGEAVRDWGIHAPTIASWPYDPTTLEPPDDVDAPMRRLLWPFRAQLSGRVAYGASQLERGLRWFEYSMFFRDRFRTPLTIAFAFVATHNHFVLDRGGKVFNRTAPIIKLPEDATEEDHLGLLGLLNSSVGDFWMKQACQDKGSGGVGGGFHSERWSVRIEHDGTKLKKFPVVAAKDAGLLGLARRLDALGSERAGDGARSVVDEQAARGAAAVRAALEARRERDLDRLLRMVGLQEELDWLCYRLYGLDGEGEDPLDADTAPALRPGLRPFEITLAERDAAARKAMADGAEPDQPPTAWFERHGWEPETRVEAVAEVAGAEYAARVAARIERTAGSRELSLIERPTYKRRWYRPDYEAEERQALTCWLDDRIEAWARDRREPFTVRQAAAGLQDDVGVQAVCELLSGRPDFDLEILLGERIAAESVPNVKHHVYKASGLKKRAVWEKTWEDQHREDRGEAVTPAVPPAYVTGDFLGQHWRHRGKLDVPKERFVALTEVPGAEGPASLYGWAGWTPKDRARTLVEIDDRLESEGVSVDDRIGVLHGVWFLLPWVEWESREAADEFRAIVTSLVGRDGVTEAMLARWAETHPPPGTRKRTARTKGAGQKRKKTPA